MRFVDNDRWSGCFRSSANALPVYDRGWRDPFATWQHEIDAKRKAGVESAGDDRGSGILEGAAANAVRRHAEA
jgi:hypothetical protein